MEPEPERRSKKSSKDKKDKKKKDKDKDKKSGVRTKFLIESLRQDENDRLREIVQTNLPNDIAEAILADCFDLTSPNARVTSIGDLEAKMPAMSLEEGDEEDGSDDDE
jgi:hypothetical protein